MRRAYPFFLLAALLLTGCGGSEPEEETEAPTPTATQEQEAPPQETETGDGAEEPDATMSDGGTDGPTALEQTYIESCMAYLEQHEADLHGRLDYGGAVFRPITEHEVLTANFVTDNPALVDDTCIVVVLTTGAGDYTYQAIVSTDGEFLGYLSDV